jgi:hypothetical protein
MADNDKKANSIFSESNSANQVINSFGMRRKEWWLNVNYAEVIEIRDAVGVQSIRARIAG